MPWYDWDNDFNKSCAPTIFRQPEQQSDWIPNVERNVKITYNLSLQARIWLSVVSNAVNEAVQNMSTHQSRTWPSKAELKMFQLRMSMQSVKNQVNEFQFKNNVDDLKISMNCFSEC